LKKRNVLLHKLFLQVLCTGRDHDTLFRVEGGRDSRDQVGESLAGSCAGLDDEMLLLLESGGDRRRHFKLSGAILIVRVEPRDEAVLSENPFNVLVVHLMTVGITLRPLCQSDTGRRRFLLT
jgi:hypothetical protein